MVLESSQGYGHHTDDYIWCMCCVAVDTMHHALQASSFIAHVQLLDIEVQEDGSSQSCCQAKHLLQELEPSEGFNLRSCRLLQWALRGCFQICCNSLIISCCCHFPRAFSVCILHCELPSANRAPEHRLDAAPVATFGSFMHGCEAPLTAHTERLVALVLLQQDLNNLGLSLPTCQLYGRLAALILLLQPCFAGLVLQDGLDHTQMPLLDGIVQYCAPLCCFDAEGFLALPVPQHFPECLHAGRPGSVDSLLKRSAAALFYSHAERMTSAAMLQE